MGSFYSAVPSCAAAWARLRANPAVACVLFLPSLQCNIFRLAVSQLRRLGPGFETGSGHVGFVVDEEELGHVIPEYFGVT
jgi:hypothetical protein